MKHGKNPTLIQKKRLAKHKLNYENWLIVKDTPEKLEIINRDSGKTRTLKKNE